MKSSLSHQNWFKKRRTPHPEALKELYKHHHRDLLQRGMRNLILFEAYVEYCFAPKHTVGEQLLDVRRDKKERAAFAAVEGEIPDDEEDDDEDGAETGERYRVEVGEPDSEPEKYETWSLLMTLMRACKKGDERLLESRSIEGWGIRAESVIRAM